MPDVCMCTNTKCPLMMKCYRYTAVPTPGWQSFSDFKCVNGVCEYFWDNKGYRQREDIK